MSMRDRHEDRVSLGKTGHPLGLSMDFRAYDSPNLNDETGSAGLNSYMLSKFGGGGRVTADIDTRAVEQQGKDTMKAEDAKSAKDAKGSAVEKQVEAQFDEIKTTSDKFQNSLKPDQKSALDEARNDYFDNQERAAQIRTLEKQRRSAKPAERAALDHQIEDLAEQKAATDKKVRENMALGFQDWNQTLGTDNGSSQVDELVANTGANTYAGDRKKMGKMSAEQLDEYVKSHGFKSRDDFKGKGKGCVRERDCERGEAARGRNA